MKIEKQQRTLTKDAAVTAKEAAVETMPQSNQTEEHFTKVHAPQNPSSIFTSDYRPNMLLHQHAFHKLNILKPNSPPHRFYSDWNQFLQDHNLKRFFEKNLEFLDWVKQGLVRKECEEHAIQTESVITADKQTQREIVVMEREIQSCSNLNSVATNTEIEGQKVKQIVQTDHVQTVSVHHETEESHSLSASSSSHPSSTPEFKKDTINYKVLYKKQIALINQLKQASVPITLLHRLEREMEFEPSQLKEIPQTTFSTSSLQHLQYLIARFIEAHKSLKKKYETLNAKSTSVAQANEDAWTQKLIYLKNELNQEKTKSAAVFEELRSIKSTLVKSGADSIQELIDVLTIVRLENEELLSQAETPQEKLERQQQIHELEKENTALKAKLKKLVKASIFLVE